MNQILSEKEYQRYVIEKLKSNGYLERDAHNYDRLHAIDKDLLIQFLDDTQPEKMEKLRKVYKADTEDTIVGYINTAVTQRNGSLLNTLKRGIEISNTRLELMYTKPATDFNKELSRLYDMNIFSVMEEVWCSDKERIDLVIFLNGIAIMSFELKCNMAGQDYTFAINQYRTERDPKNRLFLFKAGTLVNLAMDLNEVYMTTRLNGPSTYFLPFNKGNGEGINAGKGNPVYDDRFSVYYMWDEILKKDMLIELISRYMFIEVSEKEDPFTGKKTKSETVIFPRYHQLDCVRKILEDVKINKTSQNFLIQHSAGSGKTNEIAWLAHRLSSLHTDENENIFDNIVIITDRVVVDRQLQDAIRKLDHQPGLIKTLDDKCTSADLAKALKGNTKIIVTTTHKPGAASYQCEQFIQQVFDEKAPGMFNFEMYDSATLFKTDAEFPAILAHEANISFIQPSYMYDNGLPWANMLDMGYLFDSVDHMKATFDPEGEIGAYLQQAIWDEFHVMTFGCDYIGTRDLWLAEDKDINTPEDCEGLTIRMPTSASFVQLGEALGFRQAAGGLAGQAIAVGIRRGIFSNEAGLGSSPLLHSSAENLNELAVWSMAEVLADTLCCTLTGLTVLSACNTYSVVDSLTVLIGGASEPFFSAVNGLFALCTVIGWYYCGESAFLHITRRRARRLFCLTFAAVSASGALFEAPAVWALSDIFNGLMAFPNLIGLIMLRKDVGRE